MNQLLAQSLPQLVGALAPDDNMIAALAVLIGAIGGWYLANLGELRAKRARAARLNALRRRD